MHTPETGGGDVTLVSRFNPTPYTARKFFKSFESRHYTCVELTIMLQHVRLAKCFSDGNMSALRGSELGSAEGR